MIIVPMMGPKIGHSVKEAGWSSLRRCCPIYMQITIVGELHQFYPFFCVVLTKTPVCLYALIRAKNFFFLSERKSAHMKN